MSPKHVRVFALPVLAALFAAIPAATAFADEKDDQIRALQEKMAKLEARLADLEKRLGPVAARQAAETNTRARVDKQQLLARARMQRDLRKYNRQKLGEAEQLYQVANKNWRSDEAKQSLRQMIERFPDINRTGCAVLYLGQYAEGEERERLLKDAAEKYGDCFYGDGVQVGPYARFLLALYYKDNDQADKATALFEEIRKKFPDAVDHRGNSLVAQIPA